MANAPHREAYEPAKAGARDPFPGYAEIRSGLASERVAACRPIPGQTGIEATSEWTGLTRLYGKER